jgi:cytochrome c556
MAIPVKTARIVALGAALLVTGAAGAAAQGRGGDGPPPLTPLTYRQGVMQNLQANVTALTAVRNGSVGSPNHVAARATIIQQLVAMFTELFPEGSGGEGSRALPAVWSDAAGFAERVKAAQDAANALADAARSGSAEQVAGAQQALQRTCMGCHQGFRGPPIPR